MNRVPAHTGAEVPIVQAPMGWIARRGAIGPRRVLTFNATAFVCYTESN